MPTHTHPAYESMFVPHPEFHHLAEVLLPVLGAESLGYSELMATVSTPSLKIFSAWPCRDMGHKESLVDLYDRRPPIYIGELQCKGFVKVNGSWVLHGVIHYVGGDLLDSAVLKTLSLVTLTIDRDRNDRSKGRKLIAIDRVLARPCEQTVNPREFVSRLR